MYVYCVRTLLPLPQPFKLTRCAKTSLQRLRALEKDAYDQKAGQCLFQSMIALADKNNYPVTESQLVSESGVMLFAGKNFYFFVLTALTRQGTDTTAGTLAVGLFHILQRPDVYTQLQDELRKAMPDRNSRLPYSELEKLPLLDACLKEGLRLTVPLRGRLPRVVPEDGWEFQGIHFKPGVSRHFKLERIVKGIHLQSEDRTRDIAILSVL